MENERDVFVKKVVDKIVELSQAINKSVEAKIASYGGPNYYIISNNVYVYVSYVYNFCGKDFIQIRYADEGILEVTEDNFYNFDFSPIVNNLCN